jgi:hypothetical protein
MRLTQATVVPSSAFGTFSRGEKGFFEEYLRRSFALFLAKTAPQVFVNFETYSTDPQFPLSLRESDVGKPGVRERRWITVRLSSPDA